MPRALMRASRRAAERGLRADRHGCRPRLEEESETPKAGRPNAEPAGMSRAPAPILLADIGGTNARFAMLEGATLRGVASLPVAAHPSPLAAIRAYLAGDGRGAAPTCAAIAA